MASLNSASASGMERGLYSFGTGKGADGLQPVAGVIAANGTFYGTTLFGGANNNDGVVFELKR